MSKNRNIIEGRILSFDKSPFNKDFDFSSLKIDKKRIFVTDGIIDSIELTAEMNLGFLDQETLINQGDDMTQTLLLVGYHQ